MTDSFQLREDYADDRLAPPARPSLMLPVAAVLAFALETILLLIARADHRAAHSSLFKDAPVFLMAALPYMILAGMGLMVRRDRTVQAALLPVLLLMTLAGVWAAVTKTTPSRGGFEWVKLIFAYLAQWATVALALLVGFVALAGKRW